MKKLSSLLFLILFLVSGYAQQIQWAKKRQVPYGAATEILTDKWGNIYEYGGTSYQSKSYLQKFSSLGDSIFSITWQPNFYISKLIYNGEDHFYFAGYFSNEHTYNGITIKSRGGRDGMFGRMDLNGNIEWLKSLGGSGMNSVNSIYFNQITNQLIITGGIENEIYLNNNFQGNFSQSAFIATLNLQGDLIYLKTYDFLDNLDDVYGSNAGIEVTGDNSGNYYLLFDRKGLHPLEAPEPRAGRYVGKLTSSFDIIWSKYVNGPGCYYGWSLKKLKLDKAGDPYLLNYCSGKYGGTGTIIQYNAKTGNSLWSYSYKCEIGYTDFHFTKDNSLFLTGNEGANIYPGPGTSSGYHIIKKFDADKKILGETRFHEARIHGITEDNQGNLYVIGQTLSDTVAIGNDVIINTGPYYAHFISKIQDIPCTPPLVNISARYFYDYRYHFCFGDTATLEATDGYTNYEWSTGETARIIKSAESATYWVKVTEKSGCVSRSQEYTTYSHRGPAASNICLITVDEETGNNRILWRSVDSYGILYYNVYKEVSEGYFEFIDTVSYNNNAEYIDSMSYSFEKPARYKISAVDTCEYESTLSESNRSIHLKVKKEDQNYILSWNAYDGLNFNNYYIFQGPSPENLTLVDSVKLEQLHYETSIGSTPSYFKVQATRPYGGCSNQYGIYYKNSSSNIAYDKNPFTGTTEQKGNEMNFFPNPVKDFISIQISEKGTYVLRLYNVLGELIKREIITENVSKFSMESLQPGIYFILIGDENNLQRFKIIKSH